MRIRLGLAVLFLSFLLPAPAATDCLDYSPAFQDLGTLAVGGAPHAVAVSGDLIFVGTDSAGVQVVNASDPATPLVLATIPRPARTRGVSVSGNLLAMAGPSGLDLADVSDPAAPQLRGSFATGAEAVGVVLRDSVAFLVDSSYGVLVIDCSNPDSLAVVDSLHTQYPAVAVAVSKDLINAYVLDYLGISRFYRSSGHYAYVNRSNALDKPRALTIVEEPAQPFRIFVADATLGFVMFNSFLNTPETRAVDGGLVGISHSLSLIHGVSGNGIVYRFEPGDLNSVSLGENLALPEGGAVASGGNKACVAAPGTGLEIVASHDLYLASLGIAQNVGVATASSLLVTTSDHVGATRVYDLSSPRSPVLLGSANGASDVAMQGTHAYLATGTGLLILDLADPSSPQTTGSLVVGNSTKIAISGNYAFLTGGSSGFHVVNVSDPANPLSVASLPTLDSPNDMFLSDPWLYLVNDDSLEIVDVGNPASPQVLSAVSSPALYASSVVASSGIAYVANGTLTMLDVSDPQNPQPAGTVPMADQVWGLAVDGPVLYAHGRATLSVLDISNPTSPALIGSQPTPSGSAFALAVGDDYTVLAEPFGTYILAKNCEPVTPVLLSSFVVREQNDGVVLRWETGTCETAGSFRLTGGDEIGSWDVPVRAETPSTFAAHDRHPGLSAGTHVIYTLEYQERDGTWGFLAKRSLDLRGRGLSLPILQAGPNPTAAGATVAFEVSRPGRARVGVYDLAGREVARILDADVPAGRTEVTWDGRNSRGARAAAGVYLVHLDTREGKRSVKLVVLSGR